MTIEWTKEAREKLSVEDRKQLQQRSDQMLASGEVDVQFLLGGRQVRLHRPNRDIHAVSVDMMSITLEQNERNVTGFNKRKKLK